MSELITPLGAFTSGLPMYYALHLGLDRVALHAHQLMVNGQPVSEGYLWVGADHSIGDYGPVSVPKEGDVLDIRDDGQVYLNGQPVALPAGRFKPLRGGMALTGFEVLYGRFFPPGTTLDKPAGPVRVTEDHYFVLGDQRHRSRDSRTWGFVPETDIQGRVMKVYWSWDRMAKRVRWNRIGLDVNHLAPQSPCRVR